MESPQEVKLRYVDYDMPTFVDLFNQVELTKLI